jgi:hypothetical protein
MMKDPGAEVCHENPNFSKKTLKLGNAVISALKFLQVSLFDFHITPSG